MKKAKAKSKNRYLISVNLFLIAILMVVAVYAWFASNANNRVDAYDVQVQSDSTLQLSFDGSTWSSKLDLANLNKEGTETSVLDTMKFIAVTGDGDNFYIPQLQQKQTYAIVKETGWSNAKPNEDYLKFTVHMRSKDAINVYLSSDSYAAASSEVVKGENCGNPSTYATGSETFSKDCIVGALRVAGFDNSGSKKFVWIPEPKYHLNNPIGTDNFTMDTNAGESSYTQGDDSVNGNFKWNNPYEHWYYDKSGETYTLTKMTDNVLTSLPDTVQSVPVDGKTLVASLKGTKDANDYYNAQATFVVWVEGCDTEARRALVDGKFKLSLVLDAFTTAAN